MGWRAGLGLWMLLLLQWVQAAPVAVPEPLKPWQGWALYGEEQLQCPFYFQNAKLRQCAWPGRLTLRVEADGLRFNQDWQVFAESPVLLPGSDGFWPLDVTVNGQPLAVLDNKGRPQLSLQAGRYSISGYIPWQSRPDSLLIPRQTALVQVVLQGNPIAHPQIDADGRLWLAQRKTQAEPESTSTEDKLTLRVFRHLTDDIPFQVETRIELEVGGKPREMLLGKVLFDQFVPELFASPLPARIEPDGRLRVQLRPGQWTLRLNAHRTGAVDKIFLENTSEGFWPEEEVWVFESLPQLRQIRVEGVESIDPNQSALPEEWKQFPAYRLQLGEAMSLVELRRGDPQPSPNQLTLDRTLWLDFGGGGFTVEDRLNGNLYRDWRLTSQPELTLGSLELNGEPQVITRLDDQLGVEVRSGSLQATALSRIESAGSIHLRTLSSAGWQHDIDHLNAALQLPPGWRVFTVTGVDTAYNTWTGSWNVWDIFIVLIAIVAVIRLRGILAGIVCALALVLIYPEASAFLYLWLNVIAVMAILFLLPEGKLKKVLSWYGSAAALVLALWLLTFMVEQARLGLYPQLSQPWVQMGPSRYNDTGYATPAAPMAADEMRTFSSAPALASLESAPLRKATRSAPKIERIDPNLAAQTGPGRPNWDWLQTSLYWSGPVTQAETFNIWLVTPWENRILSWLRVLLGVLMLVSVLGVKKIGGQWKMAGWRSRIVQPAAAGLLLMLVATSWAPDVRADIPDAAILDTLKQRLISASDCTPTCIGIERMQVDLSANRLTLRMMVHASNPVYWPLPDSQKQWHIDAVLLDGEAHPLLLPQRGDVPVQIALTQVNLPAGQHELQLSGSIDAEREFQLTFAVTPHNIGVNAAGWQVRGVENGRLLANGLYFDPPQALTSSSADKAEQQLVPAPIPPFVKIRREIRLGLNWYLETTVDRVAPQQGGITLDIPLLEGESVTSQTVKVTAGKVRVELKPGQSTLNWFSSLDKSTLLTLEAEASAVWSEQWVVDPSPLWHVSSDGIAPVKESGVVDQWRPQWRPYPGEKVVLHIQRPEAMAGSTTTIDQVQQTFTPGQRESQNTVRFHVISSKGSEQRVELPAGARITQVRVDDDARATDENTQRVIVPVNPGQHWVDVQWRETAELGLRAFTPAVTLNSAYVNHGIQVQVPENRWVLFAGGPSMGPAILFWGVLLVTLLIAVGLGRFRQLPLNTLHWLLLVLGLCAGWIQLMIPVALWFFAMHKRSSLDPQRMSRLQFNLMQLMLAGFTLVTFMLLVAAIPNGLLGSPDMGVVGNGSSQHLLNWFVDRGENQLTQAWFISIPLWIYRALMLLWSLWLALKLMGWLKWGWQAFTHEGYWRNDKIQRETASS